jgi:hypothetical protein
MAANSPRTAQIGCFIGGLFTFFIGVPFGYLGAITRYCKLQLAFPYNLPTNI